MKTILVTLLLLSSFSANAEVFNLETLLKTGTNTAEIRIPKASPFAEAVAAKFKNGVKKNSEWFNSYIKQHSGQTLPWHKNLGVTESEYKEFLRQKDTLKFRKVLDTLVTFKSLDRGTAVSSSGKWPFFDKLKLSISKDRKQLKTAFATLSNRREIAPNKNQTATGPWKGSCWKDNSSTKSYTNICIGEIQKTKQKIIIYEARNISQGNPHENSDFAVYY